MSSLKISLGVLQRVSEFLANLPEDQLADLAEGRAQLAYVRSGETEPVAPKKAARPRAAASFVPSAATLERLHRLDELNSREDAEAEIASLAKHELVDIAKALKVPRAGSLGMVALRLEIVQA